MTNTSTTHPSIFPTLTYADAPAAVRFLTDALGFDATMVMPGEEDGTIAHAELRLGNGMVMVGSKRDEGFGLLTKDHGPSSIYLVIDDPDAHHERAVAAGAEVVMALVDQDYGSREYTAKDPEGNLWTFGTYQPFATGS